MAWPILGTVLSGILAGGAASGAAAGGAGSTGALSALGISGLSGDRGVQIPPDPNKMGATGGGDFWGDFTKQFQGPEGWRKLGLKKNEQAAKAIAGATNLSQTVRPRGFLQKLGPQSNHPYARQWPNPGTTALQALLNQMAMRRGGGI